MSMLSSIFHPTVCVVGAEKLVPDSLVLKLHIWSKNMEYAVVVKHARVHIHKADN
jgi:hypothetical protein